MFRPVELALNHKLREYLALQNDSNSFLNSRALAVGVRMSIVLPLLQ